MTTDNFRLRFLLKLIAAISQAVVGLALLGIVPGINNIDGWFARIFGPVLLATAAYQLVSLARRNAGKREAG
ncbi:hypothetical protein ACQ86G_10340 [Roseateles chitinivorans]|uniref:hypothetical protein n=1 Tax=Roseateles chitinivorans TaxID=2917965 RepID=UPI003D677EB3